MGALLRELANLPADARASWRRDGARGLLGELKARSLARLVHRTRLLIVHQDLAADVDVGLPEGVSIAPFAGPDWSPLAPIATRRTLARFREAARRGRACLVAWRDGRPVGYTWISAAADRDLETYPIPLPDGAAYLWDLYVVPAERNRGVGSALVAARMREARRRGFRLGVRAIHPRNRASLRTLEKTGGGTARIVGELTFLRLAGRARARLRELPGGAAPPA